MRLSRRNWAALFVAASAVLYGCTDASRTLLMPADAEALLDDSGETIMLPPIVVVVPPPEDPCGGGSCAGDPGEDGDTGGGGGGGYSPPPGDPNCDPHVDPECEQPLTLWDHATLEHALTARLRTSFTDPEAERACRQLESVFQFVVGNGQVFRGGSNSAPDISHPGFHYGAYDPESQHIHIDPIVLDRARGGGDHQMVRELANTALHEAAHAAGYMHSDAIIVNGHTLYAEAPFSHLNPGANSCILY